MASTSKIKIRSLVVYFVLAVLTIIMLKTISQYSAFSDHIGFLNFKQEYLGNIVWKSAFYIHVFSCFFCLLAGFTQFSNFSLARRPLHKLVGKLYAYNIFLINFPAGFILAIYANGHLPSKIAFMTLDTLWFIFTLKGVMYIKAGDIKKHREFMIRSYALTLSALTLRLWKQFFMHYTSLDYGTVYMIDAWLGFVPNLLIAEWIISKTRNKLSLEIKVARNDIGK